MLMDALNQLLTSTTNEAEWLMEQNGLGNICTGYKTKENLDCTQTKVLKIVVYEEESSLSNEW